MAGALSSSGAVFPRVTAEQLTAQSQLILEGNIVRSWTAWDPEHKYIWTHFEVAVTDALRGARTSTITISEPGGDLEGIHQRFSGAVSYSRGEAMVLFLSRTPIGYWRVVGGPQGKFSVGADGRVQANAIGGAVAAPSGRGLGGTPLSALDRLPLAQFKAQVRRLAAAHPFRAQ